MFYLLLFIYKMYPDSFVRLLAKVEYGNSIFLKKLASKALRDGNQDLHNFLLEQSKEEERHGKMLSSLVDRKERFSIKDNGYVQSVLNYSYYTKESNPSKLINWVNNTKARFVNLDGLSKRYFTSKLFFRNKSAFDYNWPNQLAFMIVLEEEIYLFYSFLYLRLSNSLASLSFKLSSEELDHSRKLYSFLKDYPNASLILKTWQTRLTLSKFGILIDSLLFILSNSKRPISKELI